MKRSYHFYIIILWGMAFFTSHLGLSQSPYFNLRNISIKEGLPGPTVRCIEQGKQGCLWLGIEAHGISRYDGFDLRNFKHDPLDSSSLSSNYVHDIHTDYQRRIWIGTSDGLNYYRSDKGDFERFYPAVQDSTSSKYHINVLFQNDSQFVWIGTHHGLDRIRLSNGKIEQFFPFSKNEIAKRPGSVQVFSI